MAIPRNQEGQPMRIGLLAPPVESVPPSAYGGTERVVASLADALVERGHQVTLFASGDSRTSARLVPIVERAIWHDERFTDPLPFWTLAMARAYAHAGELDVMHSHADYFAVSGAARAGPARRGGGPAPGVGHHPAPS